MGAWKMALLSNIVMCRTRLWRQRSHLATKFNRLFLLSPTLLYCLKHDGGLESFPYAQMQGYISADCHQHVGQIPEYPTSCSIKCENNGQPSPLNESSYASNQVQSVHVSFESPSARDVRRRSFHDHRYLQGNNFVHLNGMSPTAVSDPVAVLKQVQQTENDTDGHSEVDGISIGVKKELDPSIAQDSSSVSSVLDEISLEATSFRQLQQVMEQVWAVQF